MKKGKILNKRLNEAISAMGHGDILVISDAGFPIPREAQRVDLAIQPDIPSIVDTLQLLKEDFIYERVVVAEEQRDFNPKLFAKVQEVCDRAEVETIPHSDLINSFPDAAKFVIRTGAFEPWGNVVLYSGVDAPVWFQKEGAVVPDYYEKRASYEE